MVDYIIYYSILTHHTNSNTKYRGSNSYTALSPALALVVTGVGLEVLSDLVCDRVIYRVVLVLEALLEAEATLSLELVGLFM